MNKGPEKGDEYTCSMCGQTYLAGWAAEEAQKEQEHNKLTDVECELLCDDCYKKSPWGKSSPPNWEEIANDENQLPLDRFYAWIQIHSNEEGELDITN